MRKGWERRGGRREDRGRDPQLHPVVHAVAEHWWLKVSMCPLHITAALNTRTVFTSVDEGANNREKLKSIITHNIVSIKIYLLNSSRPQHIIQEFLGE